MGDTRKEYYTALPDVAVLSLNEGGRLAGQIKTAKRGARAVKVVVIQIFPGYGRRHASQITA